MANLGDIDPAMVSAILIERREVGPDVARRIAMALDLPQWVAFIAGGLVTEKPDSNSKPMPPVLASILHELSGADERDERMVLAVIQTLMQHLGHRGDLRGREYQ